MLQTRAMVEEMFQHTAARRRLDALRVNCVRNGRFQHTAARRRLGFVRKSSQPSLDCFNTQPPEGGWERLTKRQGKGAAVSTHSRPKAAGADVAIPRVHETVSTHSRPKAAGRDRNFCDVQRIVSTHSRPKAAGNKAREVMYRWVVSTHSRPKAAGLQ